MRTEASRFGILGSGIMLIFSVFMAFISRMLHDMTPATPAVHAAENLEMLIFGGGGFIVAALGFTGSLLLSKGKKLSRVFLICSIVLCIVFALTDDSIVEGIIPLLVFSSPMILLLISCVISFISDKSRVGNIEYL